MFQLQFTEEMFRQLKAGDSLELYHPSIPDLVITVGYPSNRINRFGPSIPTTITPFISDSHYGSHTVRGCPPAREIVTYINELLLCRDLTELGARRALQNEGLEVGDLIEFPEGVIGKICAPQEANTPAVYFRLFKKDGSLGNRSYILANRPTYQKKKTTV